ncbi:carbonic anhydrase [Chryseobacterium taklimakanense]|jgi:carbonic anhydrase|uniref:carbonic anhydrase n=1 Tax=Chryseobacterium taklimakanense TaxID=536441 RepID=UPI001EF4E721|nr:carbonic anhydrase [Chryseobacterium taklimakanense]MCG7281457.1 carbonic anhydrase [Chryseobacterium taklimakanense]
MSKTYETIFENNKKWIAEKLGEDADFFNKLAEGQKPEYLYIGCSDSRATAEELMGLKPGEVFVHRNIANVVNTLDMNSTAVIEYAVRHLKVKHIIVCGHYGCGGVKAAMTPDDLGLLNPWLRLIRDVYRIHQKELDAIEDEQQRYNRLVELNVQEQCINIIKMASVQERYIVDDYPIVHGWVFDMKTGELLDLNIDFEEVLKDIQKVYDLTNSEWVMSRTNNKNFH